MRRRFWVMAALVAGCAPGLPSTVPLGRGPLAASTVQAPEPAAEVSVPTTRDAAADAGGADAGAAAGGAADAGADGQAPTHAAEADAGGPREAGAAGATAEAAAPKSAVFVGHYSGSTVMTLRVPELPASPQKDPDANLDVVDAGGGTLEFSLRHKDTLICKLEGTASGNTATLRPGQRCFDKESQGHMIATLDTGTATLNGSQLVLDLHLDVEINLAGHSTTGNIDYHFKGTR